MEYTEFFFENFKGIEELTLSLEGAVTTLIGLNESGKTTILEAIFCFSYGAENLDAIDPTMASLRDPERWIPIAQRANFNDTISIGATIKLSPADKTQYRRHMRQTFGLTLSHVPDSIQITEKYAFENSRHVKEKSTKSWTIEVKGLKGQQRNPRPYGGRTPEWLGAVTFFKARLPSIWYFPNFLFELPERFILEGEDPAASSEDRDKGQFYLSTFEQIVGGLGTGASLETHVIERARSSDRTDQRNLQAILLDMGRDVTQKVFEGWNRIFGRTPVQQEVALDAEEAEDGNVYLEMKIKGPDGYYDLSERSLGFRWFFMFLLMTSYRSKDGSESKNVVFLLDEPASNLHSSAQAELLKSFETLSETCHLVYTTHSHHMINLAWLDSAFVVKNEALADFTMETYMATNTAAKTQISATRYRRFVSEHPNQTSYFQPVLDLLDYRPSSLEAVPNVVLVEGKSDFYLLRYFIDVLGIANQLPLIPGTGAGSLDPLIRLHIGWGKHFAVLLDGDAEGKRQADRYQRTFGPLLNERCLLLPSVAGDKRILEIEDLLSRNDKDELLHAVFPNADTRPSEKKALLQAILELYARRIAVPIDDTTITSVTDLLAALERCIASQDANLSR